MNENSFDKNIIYEDLSSVLGNSIKSYVVLNKFNRPFSFIYRLQLVLDNGENLNVFLKKYRKKNLSIIKNKKITIENEYETTKFWYGHFKKSKKYGVIKPLYFNPEQKIIITEESKGINLAQLVFKKARFFPSQDIVNQMTDMVSRSGGWLAFFQSLKVEAEPQELTLNSLIDYINLRLTRIVENPEIDFGQPLQKRINDYLIAQWEKVLPEDKYNKYSHSDFALSNILVNKEKIVVLDFNKKEMDSPFRDLSRFYHQLALLKHKPIYRKSIIDKLQQNFLNGYGNPAINEHALFKIYMMIHTINHLGKTARYWEHGFKENLYHRWIVRNVLREINTIT